MCRIGIITIHASHNYGAVLQAYALQNKLKNIGYRSSIINYSTTRTRESKKLFLNNISIKAAIHNSRTLINYSQRKTRYDNFEKFINNEMNLSEKSFKSLEELKNENFNYECFITGSDQTFNLRLGGNRDDRLAYYLPFVKNVKKISYASSFGDNLSDLSENDIKFIKKMLAEYSALSVREQSGADFLNRICGLNPHVVVDPTLLLTESDWDNVMSEENIYESDYIFYYGVLGDKWSVNQVKRISKATGLPVLVPHLINRYEICTKFKRVEDTGPSEFVGLIKNAKFICTTSYHGAIFSILFNKPFYVFKLGDGTRITSLLDMFSLKKRLVNYGETASIKKCLMLILTLLSSYY